MKEPTRRIGFAFAAFLLTVAFSCRSSAPAAEAVPEPQPTVEAAPAVPEPQPTVEAVPPALEPQPTVEAAPPAPELPPPAAEPPAQAEAPAEPADPIEDEDLPAELAEVKPELPKEEAAIEESPPEEEEPFDPTTITKEVFDTTKSDVQKLISRLNMIIRDKDYESWVTFLGARYRAALSDNSFLERVSSSTVLRKQKITLRELRDYFIFVVVPSRANDRVDDIEFIGQNRVKAFTVDANGRRLRLYDLEKKPTGWEIIN